MKVDLQFWHALILRKHAHQWSKAKISHWESRAGGKQKTRTVAKHGLQNLNEGEERLQIQTKLRSSEHRDVAAGEITQKSSVTSIKDINGYKMNQACGNKENIFVKSFSGATTDCMNSHACPTMKRTPKRIILHCGTSDVWGQPTTEEITTDIVELATAI